MVLAALGIDSFADFCSVTGIFVSVVGLLVVWREARAAKSAAEEAADAADEMRAELNQFDMVKSLSETLAAFDEVKTLQRYGVWELLPANYSAIKKALLSAKRNAPNLTQSHRRKLQSAIQTCSSIEDTIEEGLALNQPPNNVPALNKALSSHIMDVHEVLLHVRGQVGE